MRTLDQEEIKEVDEILHEKHPLYYEGMKLNEVYPFLKYVPGGKDATDLKVDGQMSKDTDRILRKDIERSDLTQEEIDRREQDKKTKKSLHILGFGTVAYFDFHLYLIILYIIIVLLLIPSLYLFFFYGDGRKLGSSFLSKFSIGNIGFSSALCKDVTLQVGNLNLACPTAEIREIVSFGVIPSDGKVNDAGWPNEETERGKEVYDEESVRQKIYSLCMGKSSCTIPAKSLITNAGDDDGTNDYAQFYTQVYGMHSDEEIEDRNRLSIWFSLQIILTTLAFIAFLIFLRAKTSDEYTSWDVQTTTISDYTMIYRIPEQIFTNFRDKIHQRGLYQVQNPPREEWMTKLATQSRSESNLLNKDKSLIYQFKIYLK